MDQILWNLHLKALGSNFSMSISLSPACTAQSIFDAVSEQFKLTNDSFKLMCSGRYIKPTETLESNKLKDGAKILIMKTADSKNAESVSDSSPSARPVNTLDIEKKVQEERVDQVLKAAEELSKREEGDDDDQKYFLELTDQNGQPFPISGEDRRSLLLGLTLHEKGRSSLVKTEKQGENADFSAALEYFLAAEKAFARCDPKFLTAVDNPGFLSLDIAWTYFLMKRLDFLKDAAWRLSKASECFDTSYGPNQERLITLKGGSCPEMVVYVRLYLLEAIVSHHSGNKERAKDFLILCEDKLREMMLNPVDIKALEDLGFSSREARIALRSANKNINAAVEFAMNSRQQQKERREAERERRLERSTQRRLGKCQDGGWVDIPMWKSLIEMGFESALCAEALKQTNNNQNAALGLLTEHAHLLRDVASNAFKPTKEMVETLTGLGFEASQAKKALRIMMGDVERAVNYLLHKSGVEVDGAEEFTEIEAQVEIPQDEVGGYSDEETSDDDDNDDDEQKAIDDKINEELKQVEYDLVGDLTDDPDAYLDFDLDLEAKYLDQYKSFIL